MRGFVNPWWGKITARDKEFLQEATRIVTHVIRNLETRLMVADVPGMVIHDLPLLITRHFVDYRAAEEKLSSSYATGISTSSLSGNVSLRILFHNSQPHMAVDANGDVDGTYIRQVVEHVMKSCLPPQDWDAETERAIIREIIMKIILGSALPRLTQPWFIHKTLLDLLGAPMDAERATVRGFQRACLRC